jgi:opacity protein-like surface antigen
MLCRVVLAFVVGLGLPSVAIAQQVVAPVETLPFDSPESWALQYFTSATLMTGLDAARDDAPGTIAAQLEIGWLPTLSAQQEQVGFAGTAHEDLNKAPVFFRPRVRVGLPRRFSVIAAGIPPVHTFGVTPKLGGLGIEWAMVDGPVWRFAWRAHGETGTVTGAFTCPAGVLGSAPGSPGNPTGCEAVSADVVTLRYGAAELDVARRSARWRTLTPHVTIGVNGIDSHFQVDAHTYGFVDRTRLYASGTTWSTSAGASVAVSPRLVFAADVFYTPLMVQRQTGVRNNDGLFNVRGLLSYRIR